MQIITYSNWRKLWHKLKHTSLISAGLLGVYVIGKHTGVNAQLAQLWPFESVNPHVTDWLTANQNALFSVIVWLNLAILFYPWILEQRSTHQNKKKIKTVIAIIRASTAVDIMTKNRVLTLVNRNGKVKIDLIEQAREDLMDYVFPTQSPDDINAFLLYVAKQPELSRLLSVIGNSTKGELKTVDLLGPIQQLSQLPRIQLLHQNLLDIDKAILAYRKDA